MKIYNAKYIREIYHYPNAPNKFINDELLKYIAFKSINSNILCEKLKSNLNWWENNKLFIGQIEFLEI